MDFLQFRWAVVLVTSLSLVLTGCGKTEPKTDKTTTETTTETADTTATQDKADTTADKAASLPEGNVKESAKEDTQDETKDDPKNNATDAATDTADAAAELTPAPDGTFAANIQAVLMTSFPEQTGFEVEMVACPEDVTLESGEPFACEVLAKEGFVTSVDVMPDPKAETFDWTTKGLDIRGLEKAIAAGMLENLELTGQVDCGLGDEKNPFREEAVGSTFDCAFVAEDGEAQTISVVVNDAKGNVSWSLK